MLRVTLQIEPVIIACSWEPVAANHAATFLSRPVIIGYNLILRRACHYALDILRNSTWICPWNGLEKAQIVVVTGDNSPSLDPSVLFPHTHYLSLGSVWVSCTGVK